MDKKKIERLRHRITESLRVQQDTEVITYIDVSGVLADVKARQNHVVFARRGCGKTLLLHTSSRDLANIKTMYLNCENFKKHSFPNVLIELLMQTFSELSGPPRFWFNPMRYLGKEARSRKEVEGVVKELENLMVRADSQEEDVTDTSNISSAQKSTLGGAAGDKSVNISGSISDERSEANSLQRRYRHRIEKLSDLDLKLPGFKKIIKRFFDSQKSFKYAFIQLDDFYHLRPIDQPFVADYVHRLCKDVPLYFKIATLRHVSNLYVERDGQPIGIQERQDFQPIDIDYTFLDFRRTKDQNEKILDEFGVQSGLEAGEVNDLFKGQGFETLVLAGGGVPRDCLSLLVEKLGREAANDPEWRLGKDEMRQFSRENFERRIGELKQDSEGKDQTHSLRGIYMIRSFVLQKKSNVFLVAEQVLQTEERIKSLIYKLLDYRIIHDSASALTHKSRAGTYRAFVVDIGCHAHMRNLQGRISLIDVSDSDAKERMRSAPIIDPELFEKLFAEAPERDIETAILEQGAEPTDEKLHEDA